MRETNKPLANGMLRRAWRFLQKPADEKSRSFYERWKRLFPGIPVPVRLPFGAWWLARNDYSGRAILEGQFENAEFAFVGRFLRSGMTVLDVGAHHGFYTLLASKRVGPQGRVFAFEPSPRERQALLRHVKVNRCKNVTVEGLAIGSEEKDANLFVVQGSQTGCNSLRTPASDVPGALISTPVHVVRLDDWLERRGVDGVDFIKLDVEGGEIEVLKGAERLLLRRPRPVILAEVQDIRTQQWGYEAKEIITSLHQKEYQWFCVSEDGSLGPLDTTATNFEGNYVAVPRESASASNAFYRETPERPRP
jgi:FkbM family methyltransferase